MSYKGQFHPSYLLDPETYNWIEFKKCQEIIKEQRYSCFENPVPMNPLFEEKMRAIANSKKNDTPTTGNDDEDEDWDSVNDDDDDEYGLDPDELKDEVLGALDGDNAESRDGKGRKKTKLSDEDRLNSEAAVAAVAAEKEKKRRREIELVYNQTTAMTPPGCMNPKEVTMMDLTGVLCLTNKSTIRPIIVTNTYKNFKNVQKTVAEYYAYVGEELANTMILHI